MDVAAGSGAAKLISLKHIKEDTGYHKKPVTPRVAWPGGRLVSNKEEAVVKFLERKRSRGESLSEDQLAVLEKYHSPKIQSLAVTTDIPPLSLDKGSDKDSKPSGKAHSGVKRSRQVSSKGSEGKRKKDGHRVEEKANKTPAGDAHAMPAHKKLDMSLDSLISKAKKPSK